MIGIGRAWTGMWYVLVLVTMAVRQSHAEDGSYFLHATSAPYEHSSVRHSRTLDDKGGSYSLIRGDPWMAYQRGRYLFMREWSKADGAFARVPKRAIGGATNSCVHCHNIPFPSAGGGGLAREPVPHGRRAMHLFGIGLVEMIGHEITEQILDRYDTNRNGILDVPDETAGRRVLIEAHPEWIIDFGSLDDVDRDGVPDLDDLLVCDFASAAENSAKQVEGPLVAEDGGLAIHAAILSTSVGDHQVGSIREFCAGVFNSVFGMVVESPELPELNAVQVYRSVCGAKQWPREYARSGADPVTPRPESGIFSAGDLDLLEWYLLNHPAPAVAATRAQIARGRELLTSLRCTECHVPDWTIHGFEPDGAFTGDRRFFRLDIAYTSEGRLKGTVRSTATRVSVLGDDVFVPNRAGLVIAGVYSDFRHHDLGPEFWSVEDVGQTTFRIVKRFRTAPLWGVGSAGPYGHDGRSETLDAVIRRHGGDAIDSRDRYARLDPRVREELLSFLSSLVLYNPDTLPTDVDGDGQVSGDVSCDGEDLGGERFWPEFMFESRPRYLSRVFRADHARVRILELQNAREIYRTQEVER